jgi:FkbM family methyltransferase
MLKRLLKKVVNSLGVDLVRISPTTKGDTNKDKDYYLHEGKRFEWLRDYSFRTIIDIGANEGQFAGKILTIFPNSIIHCFEPLKNVFKVLQSNFKDHKNVMLYNFGLGAEEVEKEIFKNEYSPSSSLLEMLDLHKKNFDFAVKVEHEKIDVKKLDSVFSEKLDKPLLIKIDVQGYEEYVLQGGENVVMQADVVIIETSFYPLYIGQPLFKDIYSYFLERGFEYAGNIEQLIAPTDSKILQADAVFIKS